MVRDSDGSGVRAERRRGRGDGVAVELSNMRQREGRLKEDSRSGKVVDYLERFGVGPVCLTTWRMHQDRPTYGLDMRGFI